MYTHTIKTNAIVLRRRGYSLKEISEKLKIAKSTASEWLSDIELSSSAQSRLAKKQILGQYKSLLLIKSKREHQKVKIEHNAHLNLNRIPKSKEFYKLCCALLWRCEGNKFTSYVRFTSSDVTLIQNFLSLLRIGFGIDESKLRALIHIHSYHNDMKQKKFWSTITNIPLSQFNASFQKPNIGKRIHKNYPGCIAISYFDAKVAKELEALYNAFTQRGVR